MPYKFETNKLKLSGLQDRRRKLTDEDVAEIRRLYAAGKGSHKALADRFGVSKSRVGMLVNPDRAERVHQRIKQHWRDYKQTGEDRNKTVREHRHYKQELYLAGELTEDGKEE